MQLVAYVLDGAVTTHGGIIKASQRLSSSHGRHHVVEGDEHWCPTCKRMSKFVMGSGDKTFLIENKGRILNKTIMSCGAQVIENQTYDVKGIDGGGIWNGQCVQSLHESTSEPSSNENSVKQYGLRFKAEDLNGNIYSNIPYIAYDSKNNKEFSGTTDRNGMTDLIYTDAPQDILIHLITSSLEFDNE